MQLFPKFSYFWLHDLYRRFSFHTEKKALSLLAMPDPSLHSILSLPLFFSKAHFGWSVGILTRPTTLHTHLYSFHASSDLIVAVSSFVKTSCAINFTHILSCSDTPNLLSPSLFSHTLIIFIASFVRCFVSLFVL